MLIPEMRARGYRLSATMERHTDHARRCEGRAPRPRGRRAGRRAHDRLTRVAMDSHARPRRDDAADPRLPAASAGGVRDASSPRDADRAYLAFFRSFAENNPLR